MESPDVRINAEKQIDRAEWRFHETMIRSKEKALPVMIQAAPSYAVKVPGLPPVAHPNSGLSLRHNDKPLPPLLPRQRAPQQTGDANQTSIAIGFSMTFLKAARSSAPSAPSTA
ncbi:hypothetical protein, partial [Nitratireductor aquibiodomus]|uniref:hypothetical protein n=1 Tax=Nitratireductor aquibiodomus TaxID=204799 RepID=UPI001AEBD387